MPLGAVVPHRKEGAMSTTAPERFAWLIERSDIPMSGPQYWTGQQSLAAWSPDHEKAIKFARTADADVIIGLHGYGRFARAVQHGWMGDACK